MREVRVMRYLAGVVLGVVLVVGAASAYERPIAIIGDSQHNLEVHRKLIGMIEKENPVAVFSLGDQVDDGNDPRQWEAFGRDIASLRSLAHYYPALGNHERNSPLYFQHFGLKPQQRWYTVVENGIRFMILDSNASFEPGSAQHRWFTMVMASSAGKEDFVVVTYHHPLFTTSYSHGADEQKWRGSALPLFARFGVSAVFNGHCHNYERSMYEGIYHIVSGGGGSGLFDKNRESPYSQVFAKKYHYCRLDRDGNVLRVRVIDVDGVIIDSFIISPRKNENAARAARVYQENAR
jgi:hypothetical protein